MSADEPVEREAETPRPEGAGGEHPPRRRRRWRRGFLYILFGGGVLLGSAATALVLTRPGQRAVLDFALGRVRGSLAGSLTVDEIRSPSLLGGAMLVGVHLEAAGGRPFLDADSVRLRYSLLRVVGARPRIRSVTVYGPDVVVSRYAGEDEPNVAHLIAAGPDDGARTAGLPISLDEVAVEGGLLDVLAPLEGPAPARVPTVEAPGGGRLRRLRLSGVAFTLGAVTLRPGTDSLLSGELDDLSMDVSVLDRPLRVTGAEGRLRFGADGLRLDSAAVRLPGSTLAGRVSLGPRSGTDGWGFGLDLRTTRASALGDLTWLDDRIPRGRWQGRVVVAAGDVLEVALHGVDVQLPASSVSVDGRVDVGDDVALNGLEVRFNPLAVGRLEPWTGVMLPLEGWLSGRAHLSGPLDDLATEGRLTLVATGQPGGPTTADFRGTVRLGSDPGLADFHLTADPVNYATLGALLPRTRLTGIGRVRLDAAGRVDDGIRFVADVSHRMDTAAVSRVLARGSVRRGAAGRWITDVQGDLAPLSLTLLDRVVPSMELGGDVSGSIRVIGPLDGLRVTGEVQGGGGTATLDVGVNALEPGRNYRLDARLQDVTLSRLVHRLPDPTSWTGHLHVEGSGTTADSLEARASVSALGSRVGGLHVDTVRAEMRAARGVLTVDTIDADLGGVRVSGGGDLGMGADAGGEARLVFDTENMKGLRSIFRGDVVTARDSLRSVALEFLRMEGVDVDTLPTQAEVAMSGAMHGEVTVTGSLDTLDVRGTARIHDGVYGMDRIGQAEVSLDVRHVFSDDREGHVAAKVGDVKVGGRDFQEIAADFDVRGRGGEGTVSAARVGDERYDVAGAFALDTLGGGEVHLTRATLVVDSLAWHLERPADLRWDPSSVNVRGLSLIREGADPMSLTADGTLAREGASDLLVRARGLHLDRVARIAQMEDARLAGHLDLDVTVTGPAAEPTIEGSFDVIDPRYGDLSLDSISGELGYEARLARIRLDASEAARHVFHAEGTVPVDLALNTVERRAVDRPMDVRVTADSLDAALVLGSLDALEDVAGVVSGDFRIGGTLDAPEPSGVLRLDNAAWSIEALGVRHRNVRGQLTLKADRTVDVNLSTGRGDGSSTVTGSVTLNPLDDPALDLTISFQNFVAVDRRDVVGRLSGDLHLGRSYRTPFLEGDLTVDQGTLFLDEFARSSEVVDLTDPHFGIVVDTAAFSGRPLLAEISNPFLQNLRADVRLSVPRDTWLRSEDMSVEMGGDLIVSYDRAQRDIVMVGELQALRGSYTVLGKRFEVQSGTIGFPGTPGINPTLDIQAVTRIRREERNALDVTATVAGTLTQPRVTLSSEEQGLAQSDLVSYLIFGRPSYQIATGGEGQSAAGSVVGAAAGAGVSYVSGTVATRLGAALSQQIGLDYLSISQAGQYGVASGLLNGTLEGTQLEVGRYIGQDVFVVLVFRYPSEQAGARSGYFGGARVEVEMTDDYNLQGFWEDRFLRSGTAGFGDLAENAKVIGVFIFREWGY